MLTIFYFFVSEFFENCKQKGANLRKAGPLIFFRCVVHPSEDIEALDAPVYEIYLPGVGVHISAGDKCSSGVEHLAPETDGIYPRGIRCADTVPVEKFNVSHILFGWSLCILFSGRCIFLNSLRYWSE